jgi:hypothetical protein
MTEIPEPEVLLKGRFTMYGLSDGGYHIAYKPDNSDNTEHMEIPGALVRASKTIQQMNDNGEKVGPMKALKILGPFLGMG